MEDRIIKVLNGVRLVTLVMATVAFLLSYANLPEQVLVTLDDNGNPSMYLPKNLAFYSGMVAMVSINLVFYVLLNQLSKLTTRKSTIISYWMGGLISIINIFIAFGFSFIGILNSRDNFDYSYFGAIVYVIGGVFALWLFGFMFHMQKAKD